MTVHERLLGGQLPLRPQPSAEQQKEPEQLAPPRFADAARRVPSCGRLLSGRGSIIGDCDTRGLGGSFWGWGGAGGSAFIWSPDHECGFACEF